MRCGKCGWEYPNECKICTNCGQRLIQDNYGYQQNISYTGEDQSIQYQSNVNSVENVQYLQNVQCVSEVQDYQPEYCAGNGLNTNNILKIVEIIAVFISSALLIISAFVPYVTVKLLGYRESISMIDQDDGEDALIFIVIAILALVFIFIREKDLWKLGLFALGFAIYKLIFTMYNGEEYSTIVYSDAGVYLSIIGSFLIGLVGVAIIIFEKLEIGVATKSKKISLG